MEINEQKFTREELESQLDFMHRAYIESLEELHRLSRSELPYLELRGAKKLTDEKVEAMRLAIQHLYPGIKYEHSYGWSRIKLRRKQ